MVLIELGILGPLEARRDGDVVEVRAAKERALLALLVLRPNEVVSRDRLIVSLVIASAPMRAARSRQAARNGAAGTAAARSERCADDRGLRAALHRR